ncbi:hypothetical protein HDV01_000861 [Terramyces sp. JEL0728]|nr:hypothetical protein HDV01_000861 [Terramyces sp. JEL0728]
MQSLEYSNLYDQPIDHRPANPINILVHSAESAFVSTIKLSKQSKAFIAYKHNPDFHSYLSTLSHLIIQIKGKYKYKRESMADILLSYLFVLDANKSELVQRKEKELREKILQTLDSLEGYIEEYTSLRTAYGLEEEDAFTITENIPPISSIPAIVVNNVPNTKPNAKPPIPPPPPPLNLNVQKQNAEPKPRLPKRMIRADFAMEISNQLQHLKKVDRSVSGGPLEKHALPQIVTNNDYAIQQIQKRFQQYRDNEE